ncbi:MAG: hypothetical protein JNJ54_10230 [Myxococcaceae bacterium]|nr:hypothetical protein [Myxococcaceae bacterium]
MKRSLVTLGVLAATTSLAQVQVKIDVALPTIVFEAPPPLVVVQPGVQVVPEYDDEVFFVDGWYWCRRDDRWFRTKTHRGGWVVVEERGVPVTLVRLAPGQYRKWKKAVKDAERDDDDRERGRGKKKGKGKKGDD